MNSRSLKNLQDISKTDYFREISRAAGIRSGESRREKAEIKKRLKIALSMPADKRTQKLYASVGFDHATYYDMVVANIVMSALAGNKDAVMLCIQLMESDDVPAYHPLFSQNARREWQNMNHD